MTEHAASSCYLKDYQPTPYLIEQCHLHIDLHDDHASVVAQLHFSAHPQAKTTEPRLELDGVGLELERIAINGQPLSAEDYSSKDNKLIIFNTPDDFLLETQVRIDPQNNTQLMGLYESQGHFCTQCETEGFRRITYFYDRPDVMTEFKTTITANKQRYPYLLSNGNKVAEVDLADGRHAVTWHDPSLKPCYLFAMVAGDFNVIEDSYQTMSGRHVELLIFLDKKAANQGHHAMASLKRAMAWDEKVYNREYDLDNYMIVGVSDFNFGAMENKGLNIFNTKCMLATPDIATDSDFIMVEGVIAHEYFHNWSGNRVTLRDWFQLTLKEGLTVFRDQTFTEDMTDAAVARIDDVNTLRESQFTEDAGPLAHPIRPEEYVEISNFYTATVYNKGAEVIRMVRTLLGAEKFHAAMDEYFARYDGTAITTEDFLAVMQEVAAIDLTDFSRWYRQAGTPEVSVRLEYDAQQKICHLHCRQETAATPGQNEKLPFVIPMRTGLLSAQGDALSFRIAADDSNNSSSPLVEEAVLQLTAEQQSFTLTDVAEQPVPSLFRHFSAPVHLHQQLNLSELLLCFQHDSDGFNRWEAGQQAMRRIILAALEADEAGKPLLFQQDLADAMRAILLKGGEDNYYLSRLLAMPSLSSFMLLRPGTDVLRLCRVYEWMQCHIAEFLRPLLLEHIAAAQDQPRDAYVFTMPAVGERALRNCLLSYLGVLNEESTHRLAYAQYRHADNLTDRVAAAAVLNRHDIALRDELLQQWYADWQHEPLVLDRWFSLHALAPIEKTLQVVEELLGHKDFDVKNPNRVRALLGSFAVHNLKCFHAEGGAAYEFYVDHILKIDASNSQLAARLLQPLTHYKRYDQQRQELLLAQLERIMRKPNISKDIYEVVSKSIAAV